MSCPAGVDADAPMLVLLVTGVREKRAYALGSVVKLYWFDAWAPRAPFVACSILSESEIFALNAWASHEFSGAPIATSVN